MNGKSKFVLLTMLVCSFLLGWQQGFAQEYKRGRLKINDCSFQVEVVDSPPLIQRGLSGRKELAPDAGMLFVFEQADYHSFWMKGMRFALDFIWILDGEVVDITPAVSPPSIVEINLPSYRPSSPVNYVLEVNAGAAARCGIRVGDRVSFSWL